MTATTPYQILGDEGIKNLCHTFYDIMATAPEAADIRQMHGGEFSEVTDKLTDYLIGWMGGPQHYKRKYGTVCLTDPHKPYAIGPKERDQWLWCMDQALERIDAPEELKSMLKEPMQRIAMAVQNRDESKVHNPNIIASD